MGKGGYPKGMGGMMGGGGMNNMLKQAQKMQQDMEKLQSELQEREVTATSGGGAVSVTVNGKNQVTALNIKPEVADPDDIEMLQDLIIVAINDAFAQVAETSNREMGKLTGGLNIPGLF